MVFNSYTFLVFFAVVAGLHALPLPARVKKINLLLASYLFYAAWNPPFVLLLWLSTLADWFIARALGRAASQDGRKFWVTLSLTINLGLLGIFKYGEFLNENFAALLAQLGVAWQPAAPDIVLPVGISFYTFQTLSYTLDVYRRDLKPWPSFLDYALYVTFFPQLVAGPIVRAIDFLPQCRPLRRATAAEFAWGLQLLLLGLVQKISLADGILAPVVDAVYRRPAAAGWLDAWLGTMAFSGQIFFDFAGYSTCAIGVALCLGFHLPQNFRYPYAAIGFSDFWCRWHISLSTWLRDYLYISLGGNRRGARRTDINLMLTMLLGGLWHGAAWRFVIWGGLHGSFLIAERVLTRAFGAWPVFRQWPMRLLLGLLTYLLVCVTWVFFRAQDFAAALTLVDTMFTGGPASSLLGGTQCALTLGVISGLLACHAFMRERGLSAVYDRTPLPLRVAAVALLLITIALTPGDDRAFIYFQF